MSIYNKLAEQPAKKTVEPQEQIKDTKIPRYQDTKIPTDADDTFEKLRKMLRVAGKEAASLRVSSAENDTLDDVIYYFRKRGIKTDKTEVVRIALNYLLLEHSKNRDASILSKALEKINA